MIKVAAKSKESNDIEASIDKSQFDGVLLRQSNNANDKGGQIYHVFKQLQRISTYDRKNRDNESLNRSQEISWLLKYCSPKRP